VTFSDAPTFTDPYCYGLTGTSQKIVVGRFYVTDEGTYLHQFLDAKTTTELTKVTCFLNFSSAQDALNVSVAVGDKDATFFVYNIEQVGVPQISVKDVDVPVTGDVSIRYFVPAGTAKGDRFYTTLVDFANKDGLVPGKDTIEAFYPGFTYGPAIVNFDYITGKGADGLYNFGVVYNGADATTKDQIITVPLSYNKDSFPSPADINIITGITVSANAAAKYKDVINAIVENGKQVMFLRGVLRNSIEKYEIVDDGKTLAVTSVVTAQLNTVNYTRFNGWVTVFYLTDSYNDVERSYECKLTGGDKTVTPDIYVDFGTLYVFSKEVLKAGESVKISCSLPLLYKDLTGYLPAPTASQLRVATWSYDETLPNGVDLYEKNNGHAFKFLKPVDAEHVPVAALSFNVPTTAINFEKDLIAHMTKVFTTLAELNDAVSKKPIFPAGSLDSESVYSILNYQIHNATGLTLDPYRAVDVDSLNAVAGFFTVAVGVDDTYTVKHYQDAIDQMNTALESIDTVVTAIVSDRAYVASSGLANCGSPMARKCLFGGLATQHSCCGGDGEATRMEDGSTVCWDGGVAYNPFSSGAAELSAVVATIIALGALFIM
jgi:hypothetical protein